MESVAVEKAEVDTEGKLSDFLAVASRAPCRALLLDYDGTLAEFRAEASRATPYLAVPPLLTRIREATNTRIVIVTGRRAYDAARLLGLKHLEIWGCHGLERLRANGSYEMPEVDEKTLCVLSEAERLLHNEGLAEFAEYKPAGTAIHWRGREALAGEIKEKVERVWSALPDRAGLCLLQFDGGLEIRAAARNKGDVVRTILAEMGDAAAVAYLGDDRTDEDAFAALQGHGLSVLVNNIYRPTMADVWIRPGEGVVTFLSRWLAACRGVL